MIKTPLRYDGQGINDADGQRIAKVSIAAYVDNPDYKTGESSSVMRNPDFDYLNRLFQHSPEMLDLLEDISQFFTSENIIGRTARDVDNIIKLIKQSEE